MNQGLLILLISLVMQQSAVAAAKGNEPEQGVWAWLKSFENDKGVAPVNLELYEEECGSCHFAYQPGLLPVRSWQALLTPDALENHFGDAADLENSVLELLRDYVIQHAADDSYFKRSRKIMASIGDDEIPKRITTVRYIQCKHDKIPLNLIKENDEVSSLRFCNRCHTKAETGSFADDDVVISGYGEWDD